MDIDAPEIYSTAQSGNQLSGRAGLRSRETLKTSGHPADCNATTIVASKEVCAGGKGVATGVTESEVTNDDKGGSA
jgi:hypothetical protein